jgi:hypothetical protein
VDFEPGCMVRDGSSIGIDVEAGGKSTSSFFDVKAGDRKGAQESRDGEGKSSAFPF